MATSASAAGGTTRNRAATGDPVASARTPGSSLRVLVARLLDHPGFAPELLALAAVETFGPGAAEWVRRLRELYPGVGAD
ncbi:hypothetical protein, partial [Escherichia coli]|uniref:hypothetical protein n=2 Tax=Bacteria TaxID=2 RepID=UPI001AA1358E